jgi:DNA mismatch endonuclease (patch repair protein)
MRADRYPQPTSAAVSAVMRANPKRNTKPEVQLRSLLHALGYRFRKHLTIHTSSGPVQPDIVFTRRRLAVFVDGCFWHRCPAHGTSPRANSWYWEPKLTRNVNRDRRMDEALREAGWTVLRVWEHEPSQQALAQVTLALRD